MKPIRTFVLVLLSLLVASLEVLAQVRFQEPQPETLNFQRSGLDGALGSVACASREPRLQSAVLFRYVDDSQYIYGDDGSKTCVAGSCLKAQGENGEDSSVPGCDGEARRYDIKVFGRDEREDSNAFLNPEQRNYLSGIGRIECPKRSGGIAISTAFHVGSYDTMATTAHSFDTSEEKFDPKKCSVAFYDQDGQELERVGIVYAESRWSKPRMKGDITQDIAIIKLARESRTPQYRFPYRYSGFEELKDTPVAVAGFHGDVQYHQIIRRTQGRVSLYERGGPIELAARAAGINLSNLSNLIVGDYDSNHGTSGSPIFNTKGEAIGINTGAYFIPAKEGSAEFSKADNFNRGIRFDAQFHADVERIAKMKIGPTI